MQPSIPQFDFASLAALQPARVCDAYAHVHVPTRPRVEIEKCKVPTFSGKTIDYPEFEKSCQKMAGAN